MLERLYLHPFTRKILNGTRLDKCIRTNHKILQEKTSDTQEIAVAGSSAKFNKSSMIGEEYINDEILVLKKILEAVRNKNQLIFYDVGADGGLYSCFVKKSLNRGTVIAFEPHPVRRVGLKENIKRNNVDVTIVDKALSDKIGSELLEYGFNRDLKGDHIGFEVSTTTGDKLVQEGVVPIANIIKIDVEGAELEVLRGLDTVLSDPGCEQVFIEVHPEKLKAFGYTEQQVVEYLENSGFDVDEITRREEQSFLHAKK